MYRERSWTYIEADAIEKNYKTRLRIKRYRLELGSESLRLQKEEYAYVDSRAACDPFGFINDMNNRWPKEKFVLLAVEEAIPSPTSWQETINFDV